MPQFLFVLVACTQLGCDETLPPRDEPQQFLETRVHAIEGVAVFRNDVLESLNGTFFITVKNIYSEVLQAEEYIRGDVEVWLRDLPAQRAVVRATKRDLTNQSMVFGDLLTIGPDSTASFIKRWDHRTSEGRPFWEFVNLTLKYTSRGEPY
ncbi:MAG: hypothetical protein AAB393_05730, partial [Bacteroidota bacterium]